jgi:hypothetical protein
MMPTVAVTTVFTPNGGGIIKWGTFCKEKNIEYIIFSKNDPHLMIPPPLGVKTVVTATAGIIKWNVLM